jgi:hypothetical protein
LFSQLRDIWAAQVAKSDGGVARIEVLSWLNKATLDIIGLAGASDQTLVNVARSTGMDPGFNYKVDALGTEEGATPNELTQAFDALFARESSFSFMSFLQMRYPILRNIVRVLFLTH